MAIMNVPILAILFYLHTLKKELVMMIVVVVGVTVDFESILQTTIKVQSL
jgi:hypothetical protein